VVYLRWGWLVSFDLQLRARDECRNRQKESSRALDLDFKREVFEAGSARLERKSKFEISNLKFEIVKGRHPSF
jgi:hypothetical protein